MAEERTPIGFQGLEALVSDVSLDLSAAEREVRPVESPPAPGWQGPDARRPAPTAAPNQQTAGAPAPNGPSLSTVAWVAGGVLALVWVCSSISPRSSSNPSVSSSPPNGSSSGSFSGTSGARADSQGASVSQGRVGGEPGPPGELYSYTDKDGVVHFSNTKVDSRYRRIEGKSRAKTSAGRLDAVPPESAKLERFRTHVRAAAEKYRLPESLLLALMAVESDYDHRALSADGRMGLMQLSPQIARDMYVSDAWDPAQNIEGGARYLRVLSNEFNGDPVQALAAYDAGSEAVRQAGGTVPNIPKTREFVRKVVELWKAFEAPREPKTGGPSAATGRQPETRPAPSAGNAGSFTETKPPAGEGRALSINEVRYCVFESERIELMKPLASDNTRIGKFNEYVSDYNSRCGRFRYRRGTLEQVRREAAERASSLETEARLRFY